MQEGTSQTHANPISNLTMISRVVAFSVCLRVMMMNNDDDDDGHSTDKDDDAYKPWWTPREVFNKQDDKFWSWRLEPGASQGNPAQLHFLLLYSFPCSFLMPFF